MVCLGNKPHQIFLMDTLATNFPAETKPALYRGASVNTTNSGLVPRLRQKIISNDNQKSCIIIPLICKVCIKY